MRIFWSEGGLHEFWLTPVLSGVLLILVGLLIFAAPELLAYFVAAVFLLIGLGMVGVGWNLRRRVTYRRMDERGVDDFDRL